jgi:hypothetical protein
MQVRRLCVVLALATSACAARQIVIPVARVEGREICVIENDAVKEGVLERYTRVLGEKGYMVRVLPATRQIGDCRFTSIYRARWQWDMRDYLAYAEIMVYEETRLIGHAVYDASRTGLNLEKFKNPDETIGELANRLFP